MCPFHVGAKIDLGKTLLHQGNASEAIELLSPIALEHPDLLEAQGMLGNAYALAGRWEEAVAAFTRTAELRPDLGAGHFGVGCALARLNRIDEAIAAFRDALRCGYPRAHCNLGVALARRGECQTAISELRSAIAFNPDDATAHWNYALLLLLLGNWQDGWREYQWRLKCPEVSATIRTVARPSWSGQDLRGRSILVHDEQGFGDTIQFVRHVPLLARRCRKVILLCRRELVSLLSEVPGVAKVLADGEPCPDADFQVPIASLPLMFQTEPDKVPSGAGYLRADPALVGSWAKRLPERSGRVRVGLAWLGSPKPNPGRSLPPDLLFPLAAVAGVVFHSLQKQGGDVSVRPPEGAPICDYSKEIRDFSDTAALIANMDLVISIDTAAAHLSAALGRRTWILLPHRADWRWLLHRADSPWYPTARLFRQEKPGDWTAVIRRVTEQLAVARPPRA